MDITLYKVMGEQTVFFNWCTLLFTCRANGIAFWHGEFDIIQTIVGIKFAVHVHFMRIPAFMA